MRPVRNRACGCLSVSESEIPFKTEIRHRGELVGNVICGNYALGCFRASEGKSRSFSKTPIRPSSHHLGHISAAYTWPEVRRCAAPSSDSRYAALVVCAGCPWLLSSSSSPIVCCGGRVRWHGRGVARSEQKDKSLESWSLMLSVSATRSEFVEDLLYRAYVLIHDD